ncbi:dihydrodipicolinate reductase [Streptomyces sp. SID1328]|uniref:dihydrodipicolinate reductase n=1 Tax=Streptomyces sp. SID1328 TaxID=2690250 RepID=UPI0019290D4C|nr:dihydrodipicolinate reductase [Streptomyces sp. SID1328]
MSKQAVVVGLGATGRAIASSLLQRADVEIVGAVDQDPRVAGQDLGNALGGATNGVVVVSDPADLPAADLAIVATVSNLHRVADVLLPLLERSYNVLSICEELAYPWQSHPGLARRLDDMAKAHGVTVLGSGANPGILMDTLPLLLTALTQRVESVRIRRRTNMSRYGAILSKFGLGLTMREFTTARSRGEVVGHYGFEQAIGALAAGLGWDLDSVDVGEIEPAVVTTSPRVGDHMCIEPGQIAAVTHAAQGVLKGEVVIDLEIMFGFFEPADEVAAGDDYRIVGEEQVVDLRSSVGFDSFLSTIAAAVNACTAVVEARPGLLSMGDLPARSVAAKGERRAARPSLGTSMRRMPRMP